MHAADPDPQSPSPDPQFPSGRQQADAASRPVTAAGYRAALARVREHRADERERAADERERIADERERVADHREGLADRREMAEDHREAELDARQHNRERGGADLSGQGWETLYRAAARAARNLAQISREKSAGRRAEAARRRSVAAAPYWPSWLDSEAARTKFLAMAQRQRETIAQSRAAVQEASVLCESAREAAAQTVTARAPRAGL